MFREVWLIMLVVSFILLVVAILLTFLWDIINVIDELSGRKAKRQIKMLHELNSSTSNFDRLSTNDIYSGMSSGTFVSSGVLGGSSVSVSRDEGIDDVEESTSFLDGGEVIDDDSTSFLDCSSGGSDVVVEGVSRDYNIVIIEEQSSL